MDITTILIISVVIGLIVGLIYASILKSQLKSVYSESAAREYIVENSFKILRRGDTFLYKKLEKTPIPKQQTQEPANKQKQ